MTVANFTIAPIENPNATIGIKDSVIAASCHDTNFVSSKIVSPVVTAPDFVRVKGEPVETVLFSTGKVGADTKPGTYPISFTCGKRDVTGEFTVVADAKPAPVQAQVPPKAQVPVKPKGAAATGSLVQPATSNGSDTLLIGAGAAALLAAGGAGVWAHRRHQRV